MPNWCSNTIAIKGRTKNVLDFLNDGLFAIGKEKASNVADAFNLLTKSETSMGTWRQMPKEFDEMDTTNNVYKDKQESDEDFEARKQEWNRRRKEQIAKYGVAGWYDYNCAVRFGCKWNAELEFDKYESGKEVSSVYFGCETPWSMPILWCEYIKKVYDVKVIILSSEESLCFLGYINIDNPDKFIEERSDDVSLIDEDEYISNQDDIESELYISFDDYVSELEI